jgi:DUF4097 and DUF4098 domain-containing protein YvlB
MLKQSFNTPGRVRLDLRVPAGRVEVHAGETDRTEVEVEPLNDAAEQSLDEVTISGGPSGERFELRVDTEAGRAFLRLKTPEFRVVVTTGAGAELNARTASADVEATGALGNTEVSTASGDVLLEEIDGWARIRTASGDLRIGRVSGEADVQTVSGDLDLGSVGGPLRGQLVSGDSTVREATADVRIRSVSGDQRLESVQQGDVRAEAVSGDVTIAIRPGSRFFVDANSVSGDTSSELDLEGSEPQGEGPLVEVRAKTVSGDIRIVRAG